MTKKEEISIADYEYEKKLGKSLKHDLNRMELSKGKKEATWFVYFIVFIVMFYGCKQPNIQTCPSDAISVECEKVYRQAQNDRIFLSCKAEFSKNIKDKQRINVEICPGRIRVVSKGDEIKAGCLIGQAAGRGDWNYRPYEKENFASIEFLFFPIEVTKADQEKLKFEKEKRKWVKIWFYKKPGVEDAVFCKGEYSRFEFGSPARDK